MFAFFKAINGKRVDFLSFLESLFFLQEKHCLKGTLSSLTRQKKLLKEKRIHLTQLLQLPENGPVVLCHMFLIDTLVCCLRSFGRIRYKNLKNFCCLLV